jgi:hypothetical protein
MIAAGVAAAVLALVVLPMSQAWAKPGVVKGITTQTVTAPAPAPAGDTAEAEATCPAGQLLLGGGYTINSTVTDWSVYVDAPDGNFWLVEIVNNDAQPLSFSAYAICAGSAPGKKGITGYTTHVVQTQVTVPNNQTGEADASCAAGQLMTGGGYDVENVSPNWYVYVNSVLNDSTWFVEIDNEVGLSTSFGSYAICLAKTNGKPVTALSTSAVEANSTVGANQVASVSATCGAKQLMTGGGGTIVSVGPEWRVVQNGPVTSGSQTVEVAELGGVSRQFDAAAICLAKA